MKVGQAREVSRIIPHTLAPDAEPVSTSLADVDQRQAAIRIPVGAGPAGGTELEATIPLGEMGLMAESEPAWMLVRAYGGVLP